MYWWTNGTRGGCAVDIALHLRKEYTAVIRTWNSERTLERSISSLLAQSVPPREIVVVDSGSTDATLETARRLGAALLPYPLDVPFNYSKALNYGISATSSEFLLLISSHTVMSRIDMAERMIEVLSNHIIAGVYCVPIWLENDSDISSRDFAAIQIDGRTFNGYNGLLNTCSMIKQSEWTRHPFDESLWTAEDQEWALWQFHHSRKTVRMEGTGTIDLNPRRSNWKAAKEHVAIALRCYPAHYKWSRIFRRYFDAARALASFNRALFKQELLFAVVLTLHRLGLIKFQSRYYDDVPWWLAWLGH